MMYTIKKQVLLYNENLFFNSLKAKRTKKIIINIEFYIFFLRKGRVLFWTSEFYYITSSRKIDDCFSQNVIS